MLGGLQLIGDGNLGLYNRDKKHLGPAHDGEDNSDRSWFTRWMIEMTSRQAAKGHEKLEGAKLAALMEADGGFEEIGTRALFTPIGWSGDGVENGEAIGRYMKINITVRPSVNVCVSLIFLPFIVFPQDVP